MILSCAGNTGLAWIDGISVAWLVRYRLESMQCVTLHSPAVLTQRMMQLPGDTNVRWIMALCLPCDLNGCGECCTWHQVNNHNPSKVRMTKQGHAVSQ